MKSLSWLRDTFLFYCEKIVWWKSSNRGFPDDDITTLQMLCRGQAREPIVFGDCSFTRDYLSNGGHYYDAFMFGTRVGHVSKSDSKCYYSLSISYVPGLFKRFPDGENAFDSLEEIAEYLEADYEKHLYWRLKV